MPNESLNLSLLCSVYLHHRHTSPIREGNREHHQAPPPTATATTTTQESQQEGTTLSGYNFARMKRCVEDIHPRARPGSFVQPATDVSATNTPPHPSTPAQRSGKTKKSVRRRRRKNHVQEPHARYIFCRFVRSIVFLDLFDPAARRYRQCQDRAQNSGKNQKPLTQHTHKHTFPF